ncbi:Fe(3+)-hydroxamate ABC transporter permease FhuB [Aquabacter sp. CN5-332]|uniref:Fe(3+)-hydroxamate ABC transporter permease FhuB n=1 Tax=Aquabacter sp. CN5-332 TaxID=3156608 RepID=UPI0032B3F2F4
MKQALYARRLDEAFDRKVLLVYLNTDGVNLRVFGPRSLPGDMTARLGLSNAWADDGGLWGWPVVPPLELLAAPDAFIVEVTQHWDGAVLARRRLVGSLAWQSLPQVKAGLVVSLSCGGVNGLFNLIHWQYLGGIYLWSSGSLVQTDWSIAAYLLPRLAVCAFFAALLARPLSLMSLHDEAAQGLGLSPRAARILALAVAVSLAAFVVSAIGVIAFISLAAPALIAMSGSRRFAQRLAWAPVMGAALLLVADQSVQIAGTVLPGVPTGVACALIGAPLLLWLIPRLHEEPSQPRLGDGDRHPRARRPILLLVCGAALLAIATWASLHVGRGAHGWLVSWGDGWLSVLQWRWPRVVAAVAAGIMLGMAGTVLQRMTGNPMASPEILGISSSAALGVILATFILPEAGYPAQLIAAAIGALLTLSAMLVLGQRVAFSPDRILLTGIAVGTAGSAVASFAMVSGDPRLGGLVPWMAGSTYGVGPGDAIAAVTIAFLALLMVPLTARWLAVLPLGSPIAVAVGVDLKQTRAALLLLTALITAAATLTVGPLGFVGLMGPHMARLLGLQRPASHVLGAAVISALLLITSDWLGRVLIFPYQIPAGLIAAFLGTPYFLARMRRQKG